MFGHATMNRAFRLVWNDARGAYVAVPETAKGHGGSAGTTTTNVAAVFLAFGLMGWGAGPLAQVLPATTVVPVAGRPTNAYISGNGVPIVNINTVNAAGVSHNQYTRFDVEAKGLVLNNGNNTQAARQSQLAGQVVGNVNLTNEARVIINEVVSTNRSMLAGFTEVLGSRADVIVANPYGISCAGCGFINSDRVTLTTGTPVFGLDGSLSGFNVNRGDIFINGMNATAQQILDLVTRSVRIDGAINMPDSGTVGITLGTNQWSYVTRAVTGSTTGTDAAPVLALDSSALGGMYAGRIRLIATEAGVGVRILGEVAAKSDDFNLTSAGRVEIRSAIAAARDVQIASTQAGSEALALTNAQLTAKRDMTLVASAGAASVQGGALVATGRLGVQTASLSDVSTPDAITDNNRRFATTTDLNITGATQLGGVSWGAVGALTGTFGNLTVDTVKAATLYAGTTLGLTAGTNLALAGAAVRSAGDLNLTATAGTLSTQGGSGQGIQTTAGNLNLTAAAGVISGGTLSADAGALTIRGGTVVNNSGAIYAKGAMSIADKAAGSTQAFSNSGTILADGALDIKGTSLTNTSAGAIQGTQGTSITGTSLSNDGVLVVSPSASFDGVLNLATLTVGATGVIQSGRDLTLRFWL